LGIVEHGVQNVCFDAVKITLFTDNTLSVPLDRIASALTAASKALQFSVGKERFHIQDSSISYPATYSKLPRPLLKEIVNTDLAVLATTIPYETIFSSKATDI
jgi:hypothetical protein